MVLVRLIYCSTVNGVGDMDIDAILEKSRANNMLDNITGALVYDGRHFLQCLEGSRINVSKRFHIISKDSRHNDIEIIDFTTIKERRFPQWTMGYAGSSTLDPSIIATYSAEGFDPRKMIFPDAIVDMMWRLSQ